MIRKRNRLVVGLLVGLSLSFGTLPAYSQEDDSSTQMAVGLMIKYHSADDNSSVLNAERATAVEEVAMQYGVPVRFVRTGALGIQVWSFDRPVSLSETESIARGIEAVDATIEFAAPDRIMRASFVPNDPRYNEQWHYHQANVGINLPFAWDLATGTGITVAVLDTGYRPHPDLLPNILQGYDFITNVTMANDGDGRDGDATDPGDSCFPDPSSWHGTHVTGTIAAQTHNAVGVAGVAFNAKVVPVRVLGVCGGTESDIVDGIVWAVGGNVPGVPANANPARVLNLSLGGSGACGGAYSSAIAVARASNAAVVAAAGNHNVDAVNFAPANCSGVITVAATNRAGGKASYSNFGDIVDIAAPGGEVSPLIANAVLSTHNNGVTSPGADSYEFNQGTSMAAPHVTGVVALMLSVNGSLSADAILAMLQASAQQTACTSCGSGLVDAFRAVTLAPFKATGFNLTVGMCGSSPTMGQRGFAPALPAVGCPSPIGAITPGTFGAGLQVTRASDVVTVVAGNTSIAIAGFGSNPGAGWLKAAVAKGKPMTYSIAGVGFTYSGSTASWGRPGSLFQGTSLVGQTIPFWIIHD